MLVIPPLYSSWTITVQNNGAALSAKSTISIALKHNQHLTGVDFLALANTMRDALKTLWDNGWEVGPVKCLFTNGDGLLLAYDDPTEEPGTHSADTYGPPQVATVVSKLTGIAGRAHRGRLYLPGVPQGYLGEGGGVNPTYVAEVNTAFGVLWTNVVAHAAIDNVALLHDESTPGDLEPDVVLGFSARSQSGTMRPRNRR